MKLTASFIEYFVPHVSTFFCHVNVYTLLSISLALIILTRSLPSEPIPVDTPLIGKRSRYVPLFWVWLPFFQEEWPMIKEGYRRMRCFGGICHLARRSNCTNELSLFEYACESGLNNATSSGCNVCVE